MAETHLWEVEHPYYCEASNFYSNEPRTRYDSWADFMGEMADSDRDMNLVFRWDWDREEKRLFLAIMHQRKGRYWPVEVYGMTPDDEPSVLDFLTTCWGTIQALWAPIATQGGEQ